MRRRTKNLGTKILSATLAAVMSLSLALSPLPGMLADYEGESVEAVGTSENVIFFPITIRDARHDKYIFEAATRSMGGQGFVNKTISENNTPEYGTEAITEIAIKLADSSITSENPYLINALNTRKSETGWSNTTTASGKYKHTFDTVYSYYDAAQWMLENLFTDATYTGTEATQDSERYMYKSTAYDNLILKQKKVSALNNFPEGPAPYIKSVSKYANKMCYYYSAKELTKFSSNISNETATNGGELRNPHEVTDTYNDQSYTHKYEHGGWWPLDESGFGNESQHTSCEDYESGNNLNCHFTTAGSGQFVYRDDDELFFEFAGDDDVYLFINGKLVIDMGGLNSNHGGTGYVELESKILENDQWIVTNEQKAVTTTTQTGTRTGDSLKNTNIRTIAAYSTASELSEVAGFTVDNKTTWAQYLGLKDGGVYDFQFYHMERCATGSNFAMFTNINIVNSSAVPQKTAYDVNGTELGYGAYVLENSEITYGFKLSNSSDSSSPQITDLEFSDAFSKDSDTDDVLISADEIVLNNYINEKGESVQRNITELEYVIYDTNSSDTPVYTKYNSDSMTEESWEAQIKQALHDGISQGKTFAIRGIKYNMRKVDSFLNTLNTTAIGTAGSSGTTTAIQGVATMLINTTSFVNSVFVLDYAKPMTVTRDDVFKNELADLKDSDNSDGNLVTITKFSLADDLDTDNKVINSNGYGQIELLKPLFEEDNSDFLTYTLKKFMNGTDMFFVNVGIQTVITEDSKTTTTNSTVSKPITFIPANNIYYEDTFVGAEGNKDSSIGIVYSGAWTTVKDNTTSDNTQADNVGTGDVGENDPSGKDDVHGWEDVLANDPNYSDGSTHFTSENLATAEFTFTGKGIDVYSKTDGDVGKVKASLFRNVSAEKPEGTLYKVLIVDNLSESGDYYQIPTLSFGDLPHGTYRVKLTVGPMPKDNGEQRINYYLDGIRVYNPLENDSLYAEDEQNAVFKEIRDILIDAKTFGSYTEEEKETVNGAVFIDSTDDNNTSNNNDDLSTNDGIITTDCIGTYKDYGPKNEVYLAAGQSIVFKVDEKPNYYIGLKSPTGEKTKATVSFGKTNATIDISHSTDMFYKVEPYTVEEDSVTSSYIMIKNSGDQMLSITKLRTAGVETVNYGIMQADIDEVVMYANTFNSLRSVSYDEALKPVVNIPNVKVFSTEFVSKQIISVLRKLVGRLFTDFSNWFN